MKATSSRPSESRPRIEPLEPLEGRMLLSVFYDMSVIAQVGSTAITGETINSLDSYVSINDAGKVAFTGVLTSGAGTGSGLLMGDGPLWFERIGFEPEGRTYAWPQINDANRVVTREMVFGYSLVRTWEGASGSWNIIVANYDGDKYAAVTLPSLADDGGVAFVGIPTGVGSNGLYFNSTGVRGDEHLVVGLTGGGIRPMAANGGTVVLRSGSGTTGSIYAFRGASGQTLASTSAGWTSVGAAPGISDDGSIVVFAGDHDSGPGIFMCLVNAAGTGYGAPIRIAGENGAAGGAKPDLGYDATGNPITFSAFDFNNRIGVSRTDLGPAGFEGDSIVVTFIGTPSAASRPNPAAPGLPLLFSNQQGLWSVRVDMEKELGGAAHALKQHITGAMPVVQIGDKIGGAAVTGLATHDPIAGATVDDLGTARTPRYGDHRIAFWANTAAGAKVVSASHLDSDEDGLLDHWEAAGGGIDIDQDGTVDLDLNAMGADPLRRDIFLEIDWLKDRPSVNPLAFSRTVSFKVNDGACESNTATRTINVSGATAAPAPDLPPATAADVPVVMTTAGPLAYTENQAATAVDPGLTVAYTDSPNLTGARVWIDNPLAAYEQLKFTNQNGITGTYNAATGVLTLTGTATVGQYQAALRSVSYRMASGWKNEPPPGTLQFAVNMFAAAPALANGIPAAITLHIDAGRGSDAAGRAFSINMGTDTGILRGGNRIGQTGTDAHLDVVYFDNPQWPLTAPGVEMRGLTSIKDEYFGTADKRARELAFHYVVLADFSNFLYTWSAGPPGVWVPFAAQVASATPTTLTSLVAIPDMNGATDLSDDLAKHIVKITSGPGAGQVRTIFRRINATTFNLVTPWTVLPTGASRFALISSSSGQGEVGVYATPDFNSVPGNDLIVSMGGFGVSGGILGNAFDDQRTLVHELGHNLGLRHGGIDDFAYKPDPGHLNNYASLMSYRYQFRADGNISGHSAPPAGQNVNSYSGAGDPTFNDWANLKLNFASTMIYLGNSYGKDIAGDAADPNPPDMNVAEVEALVGPRDMTGPGVTITAPLPGAAVPIGSDLVVGVTAADPSGMGYVQVAFDVNGDGDTDDPDEMLLAAESGPDTFTATFFGIGGDPGSRSVTVCAADSFGNIEITSVDVNVSGGGTVDVEIVGTLEPDVFYVQLDETATDLQVFDSDPPGATPVYAAPIDSINSLTLTAGDGDDYAVFDFSRGNLVPTAGLFFHGGSGSDTLTVTGDGTYAFADDAGLTSEALMVAIDGGAAVQFNVTQHLQGLEVRNGTATLPAGPQKILVAQNLWVDTLDSSLDLTEQFAIIDYADSGAGTVEFAPDGGPLVLGGLSIAAASAALDLTNNDLILDYAGGIPYEPSPELGNIKQWISAGYADMTWTGSGITSSTAALDPIKYGLGYAQNDMLFVSYNNFAGQPVDLSCILVKFTYNGDVNLDGCVDDNDVTFINLFYDGGITTSHYWNEGDIFGYDGRVDDNDVTILNLTYGLGIGAPLVGAAAAAVPGAVGVVVPMAALPALMTGAAIEPELLVEEADVLAYAQAASPRQAPFTSASAAGGADAAPPARMAGSGATGDSAFLPSRGTSEADEPTRVLLTVTGTSLAWGTAEEVSSAPDAVLSPDGGVEGLLWLPALGITPR